MRLGLGSLPQIERISQALADELQQLVAGIRTGWSQQHKGDGSHGAVTADRLTVSGLAHLDRTKGRIAVVDSAVVTDRIIRGPGVKDANIIVLYNSANLGAGRFDAMETTGREHGEIVWLVSFEGNSSTGGFTLRQQASGVSVNPSYARFRGDPGLGNNDINIGSNRIVPVMLLNHPSIVAGTSVKYWHVGMF